MKEIIFCGFAHTNKVLLKSPIILGLFILTTIFQQVAARVVQVDTPSKLIEVFQNATGSVNDDIELLADLDFSQSGLTFPLGGSLNGSCIPYSGTMNGNGHTIKKLKINTTDRLGYTCRTVL